LAKLRSDSACARFGWHLPKLACILNSTGLGYPIVATHGSSVVCVCPDELTVFGRPARSLKKTPRDGLASRRIS
jgi:hypothetical protein